MRANGQAGSGSLATTAKWMYDATTLYIGFQLKDTDIHSPFTERDATLWKADVVEVFLRTLQEGDTYIELQANPGGARFDARFDGHRKPQWKEAAANYSPNGRSRFPWDGTLNQPEDTDRGWSIEMAIPFTELPKSPGRRGPENAGRPTPSDRYQQSAGMQHFSAPGPLWGMIFTN